MRNQPWHIRFPGLGRRLVKALEEGETVDGYSYFSLSDPREDWTAAEWETWEKGQGLEMNAASLTLCLQCKKLFPFHETRAGMCFACCDEVVAICAMRISRRRPLLANW